MERCGFSASERAALVTESRNATRVLALTSAARRLRLRVGMSLSEARALCPDLLVERWSPTEEREDLEALARQALRVSPSVAALPPDTIAVALEAWRDGQERLAAERRSLLQLRDRLRELGHAARLVVAEDLRGSLILARHGASDRLLRPGELAGALSTLPLQALDPEPRLGLLLHELGIRDLGALSSLPATDVAARLGPEGLRLREIACGALSHAELPERRGEGRYLARESLPWPVDGLEPLLFVAHRLVLELLARLEVEGRGLLRLEIRLETESGDVRSLSFRCGRPSRDPARLSRLLRKRLEALELRQPAGEDQPQPEPAREDQGIVAISVEALEHQPFEGAQLEVLGGASAGEELPELLAMLQDSLGVEALFVARPQDTWRPEHAWISVSPLQHRQNPGPDPPRDPVEPHEAWRLEQPLPRPAILLHEPRALDCEWPRRLRVEGRWLEITATRSRESLSGDWWEQPFERDYWHVSLADGRRAWIYREYERFFLQGWFDA